MTHVTRKRDLIDHTINVTLFGYDAKCLALDWLIATNRAAGRPRDLEAIAELEALGEEIQGSRNGSAR